MMDASISFPDWRGLVRYAAAGPHMTILSEGPGHKALLAGLEAGGRIPPHPERLGVYHVLEGTGWMVVEGARYALNAGVTLIAPEGSTRGIEAVTRLAFIAVRVGPESGSTP